LLALRSMADHGPTFTSPLKTTEQEQEMAGKSKFFRIAREGDTTDGRKIEKSWIQQIVKNFNREKYGARIWLEHLRSLLPDSPFKAYGDVLAVKAEEVQFDDGKKLCLFAQIDPTPELVAMNKSRQKIYTSCEISPNFANSGEANLVGLAVTDSPASLGTEMLAFAAGAKENPLAPRKQAPDNLFTEAVEVSLEFEEETPPPGESLFTKVKELLGMKGKTDEARFADQAQAIEAVAQSQKETLEKLASISDLVTALAADKRTNGELEALSKDLADLKASLSQTPESGKTRPPATGGNDTVQTDC